MQYKISTLALVLILCLNKVEYAATAGLEGSDENSGALSNCQTPADKSGIESDKVAPNLLLTKPFKKFIVPVFDHKTSTDPLDKLFSPVSGLNLDPINLGILEGENVSKIDAETLFNFVFANRISAQIVEWPNSELILKHIIDLHLDLSSDDFKLLIQSPNLKTKSQTLSDIIGEDKKQAIFQMVKGVFYELMRIVRNWKHFIYFYIYFCIMRGKEDLRLELEVTLMPGEEKKIMDIMDEVLPFLAKTDDFNFDIILMFVKSFSNAPKLKKKVEQYLQRMSQEPADVRHFQG